MSIERARADLDNALADRDSLREQLRAVDERVAKITAFLEMFQVYSAPPPKPQATAPRGGRPAGGVSSQAVDLAIAAIRKEGRALHTRDLLPRLAEAGLHIGGANPAANLSGFLSRSDKLKNSRAAGWSLAEWPSDEAPAQTPEELM